MTVWTFVDPNSSQTDEDLAEQWNAEHPDQPPRTGADMEYEEIEQLFRKSFADEQLIFHRGKLPHDLKNGAPDYYVFDIGGMDMGGTFVRRRMFSNELARQVGEHPNTTFVPWSAFTHRYAEGALEELLLGDDPDTEWKPKTMLPPNILILDSSSCYDGVLAEKLLSELRSRYQSRKRG
jgi:hypothetical protein